MESNKKSIIEKIFEREELGVATIGILAIVVLEIVALMKGVNGMMFGTAMAGIGGIVGWIFKGYQAKINNK